MVAFSFFWACMCKPTCAGYVCACAALRWRPRFGGHVLVLRCALASAFWWILWLCWRAASLLDLCLCCVRVLVDPVLVRPFRLVDCACTCLCCAWTCACAAWTWRLRLLRVANSGKRLEIFCANRHIANSGFRDVAVRFFA